MKKNSEYEHLNKYPVFKFIVQLKSSIWPYLSQEVWTVIIYYIYTLIMSNRLSKYWVNKGRHIAMNVWSLHLYLPAHVAPVGTWINSLTGFPDCKLHEDTFHDTESVNLNEIEMHYNILLSRIYCKLILGIEYIHKI